MNNKQDTKIYCFYYQDSFIPVVNDLYQPVMAGNSKVKTTKNIPGDDSGDSISEKNFYYSELTGIYWVWKNTSQDVTGSCHYRRYFTAQDEPFDYRIKRGLYWLVGLHKKRHGLIYTDNISRFRQHLLNGSEIKYILEHYDVILPQKRKLKYTVQEHYNRYHNIKDLEILQQIINEKYPGYLPAYFNMLNGKRLYANNMFILPNEHYQHFMTWWFSVLFEFEKRINPENYKGYQQRIIGFIAERLLTVWFFHQKLRIKELPVVYFKKLKYRRI